MSASPVRPGAFPVVLESDDPSEPPIIWCGHISIAIVTSKKEEENSVRDGEEAAPIVDH